jgi:DNA repair protein RecO (recombination protein O)
MEWQAPAVVLESRPMGEGAALVTLLTENQGRHAGLAKGGASRAQSAVWLPGNLVEARWMGRLADQLGHLTGELVHPTAALAMEDRLALAVLRSACAVAGDALPEREAHPRVFRGLVALVATLARSAEEAVGDYIRWEADLLADLGYGLDLHACAATGSLEDLTYVSPRTGRAVSEAAGEPWKGRLFRLPPFLMGQGPSGPADWDAGLRLTGHFLARDAFGSRHRGLPAARELLADQVSALAAPATIG